MRNILNVVKYDFLKHKNYYIGTLGVVGIINIAINFLINQLLANLLCITVNIFFVLTYTLYLFISMLIGVNKESALIFQTPTKGVEYILGKCIQFILMLIPFLILPTINAFLAINYLDIGGVDKIIRLAFIFVLEYIIGSLILFVYIFSVFIISKGFNKGKVGSFILFIVINYSIGFILSIMSEVIDKMMPYYYFVQYPYISIQMIILIITGGVILLNISSKIFDKGLDFK